MNNDDFTISEGQKQTTVTREKRDEHAREVTKITIKEENIWKKMRKKGLHPGDNLDIISFFLFGVFVGVSATLAYLEQYRVASVFGIMAAISVPVQLVSKKGDLAILCREYLFMILSKMGEKSEKEIEKQSELTIWKRIQK